METVEGVLPFYLSHDEARAISIIAFLCPTADAWISDATHELGDYRLAAELTVGITLAIDASGAGGDIGVGDGWIFNFGHRSSFFCQPEVATMNRRLSSFEYVKDVAPK